MFLTKFWIKCPAAAIWFVDGLAACCLGENEIGGGDGAIKNAEEGDCCAKEFKDAVDVTATESAPDGNMEIFIGKETISSGTPASAPAATGDCEIDPEPDRRIVS
ncbi:hypothetical protein BC939DRAFT_475997 [Gamsiella multidivaricata]|uniref:uncharacterized protein n=1 Tax=Gamsiella multidivaricata TaxID=101098 RepID=UPI0022206A9B|nr:uncharacterized protein BC939DRAFT_475997 [Gamsiella multidivaricata]KAI7826048.1 hypothetical protein BC939DRAFT_475997 [Gamsiella multidivaricata]